MFYVCGILVKPVALFYGEPFMAQYEDKTEVTHHVADKFRLSLKPGTTVPHSGIYMCLNCRDEVAANRGDPLPPQNHRQHSDTSKPIVWRLLVATQNGPPNG